MKVLHMVAFTLLVVGGLNWGLSVLGYNLVDLVFGTGSSLSKLIYLLVGASALYIGVTHKNDCKVCSKA